MRVQDARLAGASWSEQSAIKELGSKGRWVLIRLLAVDFGEVKACHRIIKPKCDRGFERRTRFGIAIVDREHDAFRGPRLGPFRPAGGDSLEQRQSIGRSMKQLECSSLHEEYLAAPGLRSCGFGEDAQSLLAFGSGS